PSARGDDTAGERSGAGDPADTRGLPGWLAEAVSWRAIPGLAKGRVVGSALRSAGQEGNSAIPAPGQGGHSAPTVFRLERQAGADLYGDHCRLLYGATRGLRMATTSVHQKCLEQIAVVIQGLDMTGLDDDHVYVR